jgi:hypothetical protein
MVNRGRSMEINMSIVINESAYDNAIQNAIRANASLTRSRAWQKDEDYDAVRSFMIAQFDKSVEGSFWYNIWENTMQWGAPSEKIKTIVRERMAKAAEHKAKYAALDAKSQHIGQIKDRIVIEVKINFTTTFHSDFGFVTISGMRDADGNVYIHKGTNPGWDKGDTLTINASIKGHSERDGVKQTLLTRPKIIEVKQLLAA